jgi:hypothetical protein
MTRNLASIQEFEKLWAGRAVPEFNLFLGAGISKDPPTNGPIWTQMQAGFLSALFGRMESENWPIIENYPQDREIARELDVRPETFWRLLLESCREEVVWSALQAADLGPPNRNHQNIAALLTAGRCRLAVTTNFDEHIERLLSPSVHVKVITDQSHWALGDVPTYLKLHGSVSAGTSLSYTLEQYDGLRERHMKLVDALSGRPLIVAGYSGYDTDVLPALKQSVGKLPWVVVIRHPGSPATQPILELGKDLDNVYLLELRSSEVFDLLTRGFAPADDRRRTDFDVRTSDDVYRSAAGLIEMPYCPFYLMHLFSLVGSWQLVTRYGWLTHDACLDTRYRDRLADPEFRNLHTAVSYALKLAGDDSGSRIMLSEASNSLDETGGSVSEAIKIRSAAAFAQGAPDRQGPAHQPHQALSESQRRPSDVLSFGQQWTAMLKGPNADPKDTFSRWWQIGIARRRERDSSGAVEAFNQCAALMMEHQGLLSRLEDGHFLLDYGGALLDEAQRTQSDELLGKADVAYQMSERVTREIGDWPTNARALFMRAQVSYISDLLDEAKQSAASALESALKTHESALSEKIQRFINALGSSRPRQS